MGSVYSRYVTCRWYLRYKDASGEWRHAATDYYGPGQKRSAERLLARVEEKIRAGVEAGGTTGPLTVAAWSEQWLQRRAELKVEDRANDAARLRDHILPVVGAMLLRDVRPRHIVAVIDRVRAKGRAPKTVRNVYSVCKAMFRDALLRDLIDSTPCMLGKYELGKSGDAKQGWRATAVYVRDELEALIGDERIPWDRQVLYGLEGLAGLRHGEAAGLRWGDWETSVRPLSRLTVARSYARDRTKTGRTRYVPVHPTLAAMLAEWRLRGWPEMMGRQPTDEDLIVPMPASRRVKLGKMRTKNDSWKRLSADLELLGLRHRRGHDLRRTMISLARTDGARRDLLELITHTPKSDAAIEAYTTFDWPTLCAEIVKIRVSRRKPGAVVAMAAGDEACHGLVTPSHNEAVFVGSEVVEAPGIEPGRASHPGASPGDAERCLPRRRDSRKVVDIGQARQARDRRDKADPMLDRELRRAEAGRLLRAAIEPACRRDLEATHELMREAAELLELGRRER